ncbi:RNA polymerase subunit sigma-24 [Fervidicella metallireducens AeB]|uniref:RNA polymerase subunit sigma-24 n=1 Tax=Fervidicella metallireducens AeB TaxID=1403537 RepID=A0A017RV58_9CLOT|nr:RNA polymerase subunit sigma-24 [Fervidicella metallireducens AeB]
MGDNEIIEGLKRGDDECFYSLVDLYKKRVVSLCYSYTHDYHEAEDLSQEVFLKLYKTINKFRGESSLSTYIYRITISSCIDYKRKKSLKNFLTGLKLENKSQEIEDLDEKRYIRQCILNLPEELKTPVVLYYYIGLTHKEIGEVLNISSKTVEGRIYRAKIKLKSELDREGYSLCSKSGMI